MNVESDSEEEDEKDCCSTLFGVFCAICQICPGPCCYCCMCCCIAVPFLIGAITLALNRNYSCSLGDIEGIPPPYDGNLLPRNVTMVEYWNQGWQFTKQIDVFDPNLGNKKIGQFYDMNFLFWMRFGYSDASGQIWFEAKRPWFKGASSFSEYWRRNTYAEEHYYLQRCDSPYNNDIFNIDEDTSTRPWWCQDGCMRVFDVSKQEADNAVRLPEAKVHFNYTLEWYFSGFKTREAWNMKMVDPRSNKQIAYAHQSFTLKNYFMSWQQRWISHWNIYISEHETNLPDWVITFMAALDDIDESSEEGKSH